MQQSTMDRPHPRITRVLPATPAETHATWQGVAGERPRHSIWLQGREPLHVWGDRVVAASTSYPLDEDFGVRVVPDPRAPLTVDPQIGLALLTPSGRWDFYVPANEADLWPTVFAMHEACRARGIEPIGLADEERGAPPPMWGAPDHAALSPQPQPAALERPPLPAPLWRPPAAADWSSSAPAPFADDLPFAYAQAEAPRRFTESEAVLVAIAHLSLLFLPVVLPGAIWLSLRFAAPRIARQARWAALFQAGVSALTLPLLGYSFATALAHGFNLAARFELAGFFVVLVVAAACALYMAVRVLRGQIFG
jgi:hypothetical protein